MPRRRAHLYAAAVAGAIGALVLAAGLSRSRPDPIRVQTAQVTTGPVARRVIVTGTLRPARTVDVGARVSGSIQSVEADFNSRVRAGQVLARLDPSRYHAQLDEAMGKLAQARAEHARRRVAAEDARAKLERAQTLADRGLVPRAELEAADLNARQTAAELKAADAEIAVARASVTEAEVNLDYTVVRSPIDGVVVNRLVEVGQTLAASVQTPVLFSVADLRRMQLLAEIGEGDVGGVRPGAAVRFEIEALGPTPLEGTVAEVRLQPLLSRPVAATGTGAQPSAAAAPAATAGTNTSAGSSQPSSGRSATSMPQPPSEQVSPPSATVPPAPSNSGAQSPAPDSGSAPAAPAAAAPPAATGVITYVAVVDVDNSAGALAPGGTAVVTLTSGERPSAVRIPNAALAFRPSADALAAVDQDPIRLDRAAVTEREKLRNPTRRTHVWKFENRRFVPVAVEVGVSDDAWTEVVEGAVGPGDVLVTSATVAGR